MTVKESISFILRKKLLRIFQLFIYKKENGRYIPTVYNDIKWKIKIPLPNPQALADITIEMLL